MNLLYFHCSSCFRTRCIAEHQLGVCEALCPRCNECNTMMKQVRLEDLGRLQSPKELSPGFESFLNTYGGISSNHSNVELLERCLSVS